MMADNERCAGEWTSGGGEEGAEGRKALPPREYEKPVAYFSAWRVIYVAFVF